MALRKEWQAKWIMDPAFQGLAPIDVYHKEMVNRPLVAHREALMNRHMLVRKTFYVDKDFEQARIEISADDYYKLYINGRFIGQGPAPAYPCSYKYNRYDISEYLLEGENVIAVHVYYQGLINRVWNSGDYRQGMIAEVFLDSRLSLVSDASWKYRVSEAYKTRGTTGYKTQFLEDFDSRLYEPEWVNPAYDDGLWESPIEHGDDDHSFAEGPSTPINVYEIQADKVERHYKNAYLIDFGHEITGQFVMTAQGQSGQVIEVRCGEELDAGDETHVRYKMRCNCDYQEFWTLSGSIDRLNHYDYKAFRYVEVILPEGVKVQGHFSALVRHYPFEDQGFEYVSDNTMVDRVVEICKNGVKYGTQEVYVDCPSREKGQYLGDFTVTGHAHIHLTGRTDLYKNTLKDFAHSTRICPGMMAVAPGAFMQEIADFSMQWPMQLHQYYVQSGDLDLLEELYDVLEGLESYFKAYEREDGLLVNVDEKWNLVDWPQGLRDNYDFELTKPIGPGCHNVINAHYYGMLLYCDRIRSILGMAPKHKLDTYRSAFVRAFYDEEKKLFMDSEISGHSAVHSNALPLLYDLFPEGDTGSAVTMIGENAGNCGVQMSYFILKALAHAGAYETVYGLIEDLWRTMVEEGATTCFEAWGKDQKVNASLCHPWASAPIPVLVEEIIGIKPGEAGWKTVSFEPHIPSSLTSFTLKLPLPCGQVIVKKQNGVIELVLPEGVKLLSEEQLIP